MTIKNKYTITSIIAIALVLVTGVSSAYASNQDNNRRDISPEQRQEQLEERLVANVESGKITQEEADERLAEMKERKISHEAVRTAVENNDYNAWVKAIADRPIADVITEDNFSQLVEAHTLRDAGDMEGAREIMEELGIDKHQKHGGRHGDNGRPSSSCGERDSS